MNSIVIHIRSSKVRGESGKTASDKKVVALKNAGRHGRFKLLDRCQERNKIRKQYDLKLEGKLFVEKRNYIAIDSTHA